MQKRFHLLRIRRRAIEAIMIIGSAACSILPYLPLIRRGADLYWNPRALNALKTLARGPNCSHVDSGETLFDFIVDLRREIRLAGEPLKRFAEKGYPLYFDDLIPRADSKKWFGETVPSLARLMLGLPTVLESHYKGANININHNVNISEGSNPEKGVSEESNLLAVETGLRILHQQQPGIVLLSQELAAALLACALFCLFPSTQRRANLLPVINFDGLFAGLCTTRENQEQKIKCIIHYFERICSRMPSGAVSFERKVLPIDDDSFPISYPTTSFWSESETSLCPLKVMERGTIEDHEEDALEVDFANAYLGGGALNNGCVQEEIRFMINPELIVGMLFLPAMEDNEAIEIVGAERFSKYEGYASSFRFAGDYVDERCKDLCGRQETRIVAIDALCYPGWRQFKREKLIREVNKAFCGFLDHAEIRRYFRVLNKVTKNVDQLDYKKNYLRLGAENAMVVADVMQQMVQGNSLEIAGDGEGSSRDNNTSYSTFNHNIDNAQPSVVRNESNGIAEETSLERCLIDTRNLYFLPSQQNIGIATGNWGCGAFGGDVEVKSMLQWLAASQASRPFVLYFTFGEEFSERLKEFSVWILQHSWTVGELWDMLIQYSSQRLQRKTHCSFFQWVLPHLGFF
eukprot:Gb_38251 [translate_table: standard]